MAEIPVGGSLPFSFTWDSTGTPLKKTYPALVITPEDVLRCRTAGELVDFIKRQGI